MTEPTDLDAVVKLQPAEQTALFVAIAQLKRGEAVSPNVAAMCVMALSRLTGGGS